MILIFSKHVPFFLCLKTKQQQPVRWVCLGQLMGRSKLAQIRKIQFNFSNQQHTSFKKKEREKSFLNILFLKVSNLNCSWHCFLLRSPSISVWQWFWQWAGWLQQSIQKFLKCYLPFHWCSGDLTYLSSTISSLNWFRKCSDLSTLNWHPKHTKIYIWLLAVPEKLCFRNTLFCLFVFCHASYTCIKLYILMFITTLAYCPKIHGIVWNTYGKVYHVPSGSIIFLLMASQVEALTGQNFI